MLDEFGRQTIVDALLDLGSEIVEINDANGWNVTTPETWDEENKYRIPAILALIHSEISEALEAYRHGDRAGFDEEMADALIRIVDMTHGLGIDIGTEVLEKLDKNRTRGYRHGNKRV